MPQLALGGRETHGCNELNFTVKLSASFLFETSHHQSFPGPKCDIFVPKVIQKSPVFCEVEQSNLHHVHQTLKVKRYLACVDVMRILLVEKGGVRLEVCDVFCFALQNCQ